jgi:hypothetical protein
LRAGGGSGAILEYVYFSMSPQGGACQQGILQRSYGHWRVARHRPSAVEYRVEQQAAKLGDRLEALRSVSLRLPT